MEKFLAVEVLGYCLQSKEYLQYRYELLEAWETVKRNYKGTRVQFLKIPFDDTEVKRKIDEYNSLYPSSPIIYRAVRPAVKLPNSKVLEFFNICLDKIVQKVKDILNTISNVNYIFLVGGFAESDLLKERIVNEFEKTMEVNKVIIPPKPYLAIVEGALKYTFDSNIIKSRIANKTYGIGVKVPFQEGFHKDEKKFFDEVERIYRCKDAFDVFVRKGQRVGTEEKFTEFVTPLDINCAYITCDFFCSQDKDVRYTDSEGVMPFGKIVVDVSETIGKPREERKVQLELKFGEEFITVNAICCQTKTETKVSFNILGHI